MQLIQLVLQLQLVGLCMARAAVEEAGGAMPGLLPAPRGVQPAGLQHTAHLKKKLLLQALHALLHLKGVHNISHLFMVWCFTESFLNVKSLVFKMYKVGCRRKLQLTRHITTNMFTAVTSKQAPVSI